MKTLCQNALLQNSLKSLKNWMKRTAMRLLKQIRSARTESHCMASAGKDCKSRDFAMRLFHLGLKVLCGRRHDDTATGCRRSTYCISRSGIFFHRRRPDRHRKESRCQNPVHHRSAGWRLRSCRPIRFWLYPPRTMADDMGCQNLDIADGFALRGRAVCSIRVLDF